MRPRWSNDGKEGLCFKLAENIKLDTAKALNTNPTKRNQYIYQYGPLWKKMKTKKKKKKKTDLPGEEYTLITHTHTRTHAPHLRPTATGTTYLFTRMLGAQCPMAECQQLSSPSTQDVACALSRLVLGKMWKWLRAGSIWNSRWGSPEGVTT